MLRFNYTGNHKEDEAYMQRMCAQGHAAVRLVEGFWKFEPCRPRQYTYRMAYLRGKSADEIRRFKAESAKDGIEFVSSYSFWAIFRSEHPFEFYSGEAELEICEKIYRPMPEGALVSALALIVFICLTVRVSKYYLIADIAMLIYGSVCVRCGLSYRALLRKLRHS